MIPVEGQVWCALGAEHITALVVSVAGQSVTIWSESTFVGGFQTYPIESFVRAWRFVDD